MEAPTVITGGSFFSRGSRFRYSGRTERELLELSAAITRDPPLVSRPASLRRRRATSLPNGGPLPEGNYFSQCLYKLLSTFDCS